MRCEGGCGQVSDDVFDYCAECLRNLCPWHMAAGCCGHKPAKSGMPDDEPTPTPPGGSEPEHCPCSLPLQPGDTGLCAGCLAQATPPGGPAQAGEMLCPRPTVLTMGGETTTTGEVSIDSRAVMVARDVARWVGGHNFHTRDLCPAPTPRAP
jgi:hypothetical protein